MKTPEIMATIGPTLEKPEDLRRAVEAGARWFRLPCGYRQRPHLLNAQAVREAAAACGTPVQLLMDLPSSRPRTGKMEDLRLEVGRQVRFFDSQSGGQPADEPGVAPIPLPGLCDLVEKMAVGHRMWFCDGRLEFTVDQIAADSVAGRLTRGSGPLKSSNSIYLPDSLRPFRMMTAEDHELLRGFVAAGISPDWIAFSLISTAEDVESGREELRSYFGDGVRVMAKIETAAAVDAVESILEAADGIMVARGDLAPAVDFIGLPEAQEELVAAAHRAGKTVVVATQILECFAESGVPQRAELSGLALLAQQSPDAIMLGKETVYSPRPIEAIGLAVDVLARETRRLEARRNRLPRAIRAASGGPCLVAIEGPNGAGKTRLCGLLAERLEATMLRGVPAGWEDSSLKLRMIRDADWMAAALFFLSGVIESSREAKQSGRELVVMDRSLWSTLAVHYAHDPSRLSQLMPLLEFAAARLLIPNLTIVLEASPETCRKRIAKKPARQRRFDAAGPDVEAFHQRERQFYHWLAGQGQQVAFLDANDCDPETLCARAADLIRESVPCVGS